jgi:hypothetical protein
MDKNWLIRTKSNHILGPISKEKVIELYRNGTIKSDDEICSGNGFWFFIREDEMVERYLIGSEIQGFNPISEAKDVITSTVANSQPQVKEDITLVGALNLSALKEEQTESRPAPTTTQVTVELKEATDPADPEAKKKASLETKPIKSSPRLPSRPLKKQNYLKYVAILGFLALLLLVYYRKTIIRSLFQGEMTSSEFTLINEANAQEVIPSKKKSY